MVTWPGMSRVSDPLQAGEWLDLMMIGYQAAGKYQTLGSSGLVDTQVFHRPPQRGIMYAPCLKYNRVVLFL